MSSLRKPRGSAGVRGVLFALAILAALGTGCAFRGPSLPPTEPGAEGARIMIGLLSQRICPPTLSTDLEIVLAPVGRPRVLLTGSARIAWPDRARIQARVGGFVPVASIAVAGDSAFVSLPRESAFWRGEGSRFGGGGISGTAASILWLLCPGPMLETLEDAVLDQTPSGWTLRGRLAGTDPTVWAEIRLPRDRGRVAEILIRDADGSIRLRAWRSGHRGVGGTEIPNSIRVQSGAKGGWFEMKFLRPRLDPDQPPGLFRLRAGPGVRTIEDGDLLLLMSGGAGER